MTPFYTQSTLIQSPAGFHLWYSGLRYGNYW